MGWTWKWQCHDRWLVNKAPWEEHTRMWRHTKDVHYHKLGASRCYQQNPNQLMLWKNRLWSKRAMGTKATTTTTSSTTTGVLINEHQAGGTFWRRVGGKKKEFITLREGGSSGSYLLLTRGNPCSPNCFASNPISLDEAPLFLGSMWSVFWAWMRGITVATPPKKTPECATTPHRERDRCFTTTRALGSWRQTANASNLVSKQVDHLREGMQTNTCDSVRVLFEVYLSEQITIISERKRDTHLGE